MEDKAEDKAKETIDQSSGKAAADRGKKAIQADNQLNKKDKDPSDAKQDEKQDAEKWRNEG
jgi:hypothetical protein